MKICRYNIKISWYNTKNFRYNTKICRYNTKISRYNIKICWYNTKNSWYDIKICWYNNPSCDLCAPPSSLVIPSEAEGSPPSKLTQMRRFLDSAALRSE